MPHMDTEPYERKLLQQEEVKKCETDTCSDAPNIEQTRRREGGNGATEKKGTPWAVVPNVSSCRGKHLLLVT